MFKPSFKLTIPKKIVSNEDILLENTIDCIKHMRNDYIEKIYSELPRKVEYVKLCKFLNVGNRPIVYVKSIKFVDDEKETLVLRSFYKSTGTSRGDINIRNYWFPCVGFKFEPFKETIIISKLEDDILLKLYNHKDTFVDDQLPLIKLNDHPVTKYCRFVTELNSYVSKSLKSLSDDYVNSIELFENTNNDKYDFDTFQVLLEKYLAVTTECTNDTLRV